MAVLAVLAAPLALGGCTGTSSPAAPPASSSAASVPGRAPGNTAMGPSASGSSSVAGAAQLPGGVPSTVTPLHPLIPGRARPVRVPILMYHYVDVAPPLPGPWAPGLTVPTAQFAAEMNYLANNGYHTVTLEQAYEAAAGQVRLPAKPVVLTFDDGGLDDFTVAFPILRSHGFVASFFVITGLVGRPTYMTWEDVQSLHASGMVIESHTVHHHDLRILAGPALIAELSGSRAAIESEVGEAPLALAYPSGRYNRSVIAATRAAGYVLAVTTDPGRTLDALTPYTWPRLRVYPGETMAGFERAVAG